MDSEFVLCLNVIAYPKVKKAVRGTNVKKVIVSYEDTIVMTDTLMEGIEAIFGDVDGSDSAKPDDGIAAPDDTPTVPSGDLQKEALDTFNKAEKAIANGDWAAYGKYMDDLERILNQMNSSSVTIPEVTDIVE